jgi:hypothetical protein
MSFTSWLRALRARFVRLDGRFRGSPGRSRRPRTSLTLEALEERMVLSAYLVTTTADSGPGSLRDGITQVNADTSHALYASSNPSVDEIDFAITATSDTAGGGTGYDSTTGVATIAPQSALPALTNAVLVNGYTQPGASPNTLLGVQIPSPGSPPTTQPQGDNAVLKIQLNLSAVVGDVGLRVAAGDSTIRGLVLNGVTDDEPAIYVTGTGDHIEGDFIGTDGP